MRLGGPWPRLVAVASDHVRTECLLPVLPREVGVVLPPQCAKPRTRSGALRCTAPGTVCVGGCGPGWEPGCGDREVLSLGVQGEDAQGFAPWCASCWPSEELPS